MKKTFTFISIFILLAFASLGFKCNGNDPKWKDVPNGAVKTAQDKLQRTPNGTRVYSKNGLPESTLSLIDKSLTERFSFALAEGYNPDSGVFRGDFYELLTPLFPCQLSPEWRTPSFMIRADSYDGTEFDQHNPKGKGVRDGIGVVLAAEMVTRLGGSTGAQMVVCPEASHIGDAAANGADHIIAANEDPDYYNRTWFHGDGIYHPLYPKAGRRGKSGDGEARIFDAKKDLIIRVVK